jgi:hypothetical protein
VTIVLVLFAPLVELVLEVWAMAGVAITPSATIAAKQSFIVSLLGWLLSQEGATAQCKGSCEHYSLFIHLLLVVQLTLRFPLIRSA